MALDRLYRDPALLAAHERKRAQLRAAGRGIADVPPERRKAKAEAIMAKIDRLPPEWRALVHEFGWARVEKALSAQLTPASALRQFTINRVEITI